VLARRQYKDTENVWFRKAANEWERETERGGVRVIKSVNEMEKERGGKRKRE
jgi:hypothetical protein